MNKKIIIISLLFGMFSCDEYLDIVPDQTQQIDLLFERKEVAYTALATCYAYLPKNDGVYTSFMMMSDEVTTPIAKETDGIRIMKGQQSASNLNLDYGQVGQTKVLCGKESDTVMF